MQDLKIIFLHPEAYLLYVHVYSAALHDIFCSLISSPFFLWLVSCMHSILPWKHQEFDR